MMEEGATIEQLMPELSLGIMAIKISLFKPNDKAA